MADKSSIVPSREAEGWRAGRPVEDPEKMKRWGFVTARPSEYLVHVRSGRLLEKSSGQGATCFKWPWDAVAIVPTSLQRLSFVADQVTVEKVGVEIRGLAVYRIAEPQLAFRVLNFSYPERAQQKLEETLTAMCVGATRRLVANLSVDDCLQKRKSALATELLRELAPVVGGQGKPSDGTNKGWGVVIDTIEIQEVRVQSESVFAAMQAPFRAALEREAREARARAEMEVAAREAECRRETEAARIAAEAAIRERKEEVARTAAEAATQSALRQAELRAQEQRAAAEAATAEALRRAELRAQELEAEAELHARELESHERMAELARRKASAAAELRRAELELSKLEGEAQTAVARAEAEVAKVQAEADAKRLTAENLPKLAAAVGERVGEVRIHQYGGDGNPFGQVAQAVNAVLELVREN